MKVPFLDLARQNEPFLSGYFEDFQEIATSGMYVSGKFTAKFERDLAIFHHVNHAVSCNSGTSALVLILQALGVGVGDEVIVPAMTFIATAEAVVQVGATPVAVDIDPQTRNMSVDAAERVINIRTKAIIFVHLHGSLAGVKQIKELADSRQLLLVEDAAQAHGGKIENRGIGNFGIAAALSFYPGKNLGALGEGGAVLTNSNELEVSLRLTRSWGSIHKYDHTYRGSNYRMDEMQAAFLLRKLKALEGFNISRLKFAKVYREAIDDRGLNYSPDFDSNVFHIFSVLVEERDALAEFLSNCGIQTGIHYPSPIQYLPGWKNLVKSPFPTPQADYFAKCNLSLPLSDHHTLGEIEYVCDALQGYRKRKNC
jgi:dTDP-4-amino-4,6-dideoxygalactose transaminase